MHFLFMNVINTKAFGNYGGIKRIHCLCKGTCDYSKFSMKSKVDQTSKYQVSEYLLGCSNCVRYLDISTWSTLNDD